MKEFFHKDSVQFDKVIQLRRARKAEVDPVRKRQIDVEATIALIPATEYPLEIANLCVELAEFATFTFKRGFRSARGDSGVALTGAIAAINGCLSIVDLNLLSFSSNDWTENIRAQADALRSTCIDLSLKERECLNSLEHESNLKKAFDSELEKFRSFYLSEPRLSNFELEEFTEQLLRMLWKYRVLLIKNGDLNNPFQLLNPSKALNLLGFHFSQQQSLGQHVVQGSLLEVAGYIDRDLMEVAISEQFPLETRNFTSAHELGHALLHRQSGLHRDRPLDGSGQGSPRNNQELQAEKFAAYFLMPSKLVKRTVQELFRVEKLILDEDMAFSLTAMGLSETRRHLGNVRGLSRAIASAEVFKGMPIVSIAKRFRVSTEAMAIRLEELALVEF